MYYAAPLAVRPSLNYAEVVKQDGGSGFVVRTEVCNYSNVWYAVSASGSRFRG